MFIQHHDFSPDLLALIGTAEQSLRRVAPLFPLDRAVAVNPFHGLADMGLAEAAARMERAAGLHILPDRAGLRAQVAAGEITQADIAAALHDSGAKGLTVTDVLAILHQDRPAPRALPTVAHLATAATGTDWSNIVAERIGAFAQSHFDQGQALWGQAHSGAAWAAWRDWAKRDLTPEILGLHGFAALVAETQQSHWRALGDACVALGIDHDAAPSVFHRLLCDLGGWAGLGRYHLWQAELSDDRDTTLSELLTIRLVWEQALHAIHGMGFAADWDRAIHAHRQPVTPTDDHLADAVLLRASEIANARQIDTSLAGPAPLSGPDRAEAQLVFCIDVRSERMRRALERVAPGIATHGAAGFFGLPLAHRCATAQEPESRAPVILAPPLASRETDRAAPQKRIRGRLMRAVARFSRAAVSSFAFVEAAGPLKLGPLVHASLSRERPAQADGPVPRLTLSPDSKAALDAAEGALRAMGLVADFAPLVVFVGHAARVTNDAQAGLLQCGACGGHDGAANARVLAQLLNETPIRRGLAARGIAVPPGTVFMAGLHDTTSDEVTLFQADPVGNRYRQPTERLADALAQAGALVRAERALTLPGGDTTDTLPERGRDWSQTRAEWGLANCHWFIAAPRRATRGLALDGRAFLHDYDAARDPDGSWLSEILGGPVLVASWINLQYFGASVAPEAFGGGNKLLQNVCGGMGVLDGISGRLRAGPSDQSLNDGRQAMHRPLRLAVRIAAPARVIDKALARVPVLKTMVTNGWLEVKPMPQAASA